MSASTAEARRRQQARTLKAILLLDAALYLDSALRWELGVGFVRPSWLVATLATALAFWLFDWFMAGFGVVDLVHGLLALPLWCWAFISAGTGNPYIDWRTLPVVDFFRLSLLDHWLTDGGFLTAGIAALAHFALAPRWRDSTRWRRIRSEVSWLRGLGWALVIASSVCLIPPVQLPVSIYGDSDPRDPQHDKRVPLELGRKVLWLAVCGAGCWQLRRSVRLGRSDGQAVP